MTIGFRWLTLPATRLARVSELLGPLEVARIFVSRAWVSGLVAQNESERLSVFADASFPHLHGKVLHQLCAFWLHITNPSTKFFSFFRRWGSVPKS